VDPVTNTIAEQYHNWYYSSGIWQKTTFAGIPALKSVSDMWNYQEILTELKPSLVIEFGTHEGGSTLFFAEVLRFVAPRACVLSVDIDHSRVAERVRENDRIELLESDTTHPRVSEKIRVLRAAKPGLAFIILDSDHSKDHVFAEMVQLRAVTLPGDYLVVEDSNINGHPVLPDWGPGPFEALQEYFSRYPDDYVRDLAREEKFGFTFAPQGFLRRR
jgi:cephalosporin hydroxylase